MDNELRKVELCCPGCDLNRLPCSERAAPAIVLNNTDRQIHPRPIGRSFTMVVAKLLDVDQLFQEFAEGVLFAIRDLDTL